MKTLEEFKDSVGLEIKSTGEDGGAGIVRHGKLYGTVIWSTGGGWDHVSVAPFRHSYTPTWDDMCWLKSVFFEPDEWAVQFHPAESEYVNIMPNCLHLWRAQDGFPTPCRLMV